MKTEKGMTVYVRVTCDDELLAECVNDLIIGAREGDVQLASLFLYRGYSYETIIRGIMKERRGTCEAC